MEEKMSVGSGKTQKKGKRAKALSAEEEARRREVVQEKLREKFELEKRALMIVERLLEDSVAEDFLVDCARFITPAGYKDTIEERCISKQCGYPVCSNRLGKVPTQQYKISTKTNKVYDITERKCFCSNFCYKASKEFELQISNTPLWLRQHESPQEIKLMKKGDGCVGSSGEEIMLLERRLQENDIEDPAAAQLQDPPDSLQRSPADDLDHSETSDIEQEQDFVSSVVSQQRGPRVHWGDLPKRTDEEDRVKRGKTCKKMGGDEEEVEGHQRRDDENRQQSLSPEAGVEMDSKNHEQLLSLNTDKHNEEASEEMGVLEEPGVEAATARLSLCALSETGSPTAPTCTEPNPSTESKGPTSTTPHVNQDSLNTQLAGLHITQVGMSKRGAAGLRDLLNKHTAGAKPSSVRLNLLQSLRRTLKDWSTEATLNFLYGSGRSLGSPVTHVSQEGEEELDEDDLDDETTDGGPDGVEEQKGASAELKDYDTLRKETQQLEQRIKDFYKGTWIVPEEVERPRGDEVRVQDRSTKDPVLPLVDSHAQDLIQKRITVEKLTSCLRNILGPLRLAMNDVSTDLNNLVRTFRFTNTNIIHKTPEWTLIAVVLLHLLSEVSPVVREALKTPASVEYLNTLMEELGLQQQDLLNSVQLLKTPSRPHV